MSGGVKHKIVDTRVEYLRYHIVDRYENSLPYPWRITVRDVINISNDFSVLPDKVVNIYKEIVDAKVEEI